MNRVTCLLLLLAAGCSDEWDALPGCSDSAFGNVLQAATLARDVDFLGLYGAHSFELVERTSPLTQAAYGRWGSACAGASEPEACMRQVADLVRPCFEAERACETFLLWTKGDQVERSTDRSSLLGLLGAIDTPADALALAFWDGLPIGCAEADLAGTRVRPESDGYVVATDVYGDCDARDERISLHVSADGTTGDRKVQAIGPVRRCAQ